ncbi:hypothetical protein F2Q69_00027164 [Brassica cretica]|uniref:Uncharacterized protein n=1 Tax=Brassica cretica TaxID=69181 RepID=A0A8S9S4M6_BRACR|nr:hypothetical protein F2Q69_00027164 [Brassica cretica]
MVNNTSRSVAESDTGDLGVNTGRGLGADADTTNVPDVTKVCSSAVSARASRQARMLRGSTKLKQPIPLANKQLMKKRGRGRPCIISEASVSANALLDNVHRPWLSPTYLSKMDTLQTIPKEQYIDSGRVKWWERLSGGYWNCELSNGYKTVTEVVPEQLREQLATQFGMVIGSVTEIDMELPRS